MIVIIVFTLNQNNMKKTLLLTAIVCFSLLTVKAQLANTQWKGIIKIPTEGGEIRPFGVTWNFQQDTASLIYDLGITTDVMIYKAEKNTITFRKVSGDVPCDTTALLTCSYEIKNDQLFLNRTQDACKARAAVDASQPFSRVKQ